MAVSPLLQGSNPHRCDAVCCSVLQRVAARCCKVTLDLGVCSNSHKSARYSIDYTHTYTLFRIAL